jgi:hypothetical protein
VLEHKESLEDDYRTKNLSPSRQRLIAKGRLKSNNNNFLEIEESTTGGSNRLKSMKEFNEIDQGIKTMFDNSQAKQVQRILNYRNRGPKRKKDKTKSFFVTRKKMNNKMPKQSVQISVTGVTQNPFSDGKDNFSPPKREGIFHRRKKGPNDKFKSMNINVPKNAKSRGGKPLFSLNSPTKRQQNPMSRIGRRRGGAKLDGSLGNSRELP